MWHFAIWLYNCLHIGAIHWKEQKKLGIGDFRFMYVGMEVLVGYSSKDIHYSLLVDVAVVAIT